MVYYFLYICSHSVHVTNCIKVRCCEWCSLCTEENLCRWEESKRIRLGKVVCVSASMYYVYVFERSITTFSGVVDSLSLWLSLSLVVVVFFFFTLNIWEERRPGQAQLKKINRTWRAQCACERRNGIRSCSSRCTFSLCYIHHLTSRGGGRTNKPPSLFFILPCVSLWITRTLLLPSSVFWGF